MPASKKPRKAHRPSMATATFTRLDAMRYAIAPSAALDRLAEAGAIDEQDYGAIQCLIRLVEDSAMLLGQRPPCTAGVRGLIMQIHNDMPVSIERVQYARAWVMRAVSWLVGKPSRVMVHVIGCVMKEIEAHKQRDAIAELMPRPRRRHAA